MILHRIDKNGKIMNFTIKRKTALLFMSIVFIISCKSLNFNNNKAVFQSIENQYSIMIKHIADSPFNPRSVNKDNKLKLVPPKDWTSGFFPGALWYLYEYSKNNKWEKYARKFTERLEQEKLNGSTHDMGFKMFCSFGNGYRLTGDKNYKEILLQSAKTLSQRFNAKVGCIRSWDFNKDVWQFPVIIDNMMNLELLFWATKVSGDSLYYNIAVSHANKTMENHFRSNYSSVHVVNYDTLTGKVISKETHQGYSDNSAWSRGQAWGLYGFTMCYRETGYKKYLLQAENIANFILTNKNLPDDGIPYWDFDAPGIPNEPRDASAAAIIASALYELSLLENDNSRSKYYKKFADKILLSLSSENYFSKEGNYGFILRHSVGNKPKNSEVDVPIIYADYYFIEANLRRLKNGKKHSMKSSSFIKK